MAPPGGGCAPSRLEFPFPLRALSRGFAGLGVPPRLRRLALWGELLTDCVEGATCGVLEMEIDLLMTQPAARKVFVVLRALQLTDARS